MELKIRHGLLVFAIAFIMVIAVATSANAWDNVNTLRIYGENGYSAAFPYTDPVAPFDPMSPEAPVKDFVTFNPSLLEDSIVVNNIDSKQKVFARQWFVPEYVEPTGMVWLDKFVSVENGITATENDLRAPSQDGYYEWIPYHNEYTWEDVVTEYTYMFVDKHYQPVEATAYGDSYSYWTTFYFPVADNDEDQIGLDGFDINYDGQPDMVQLVDIGDFNKDQYKDIQIASNLLSVGVGERVQFLDHIVEVEGIYYDGEGEIDRVAFKVFYNGNKEEEQIGGLHVINVGQGVLSAGRHTVTDNDPQFYEPWSVYVEGTSTQDNKILMRAARQLYERETFFVDGAEYDVARIYGSEYDNVKYITIRNPVPEHADVSLNDLSVVKKMVDNEETLPLLPPYNIKHTMVDDINIPHHIPAGENTTCLYGDILNSAAKDGEWYESLYINGTYDTIEERKIYDVDPLEIYFTCKDYEPRFHTDLLEILEESDPEAWKWLHIRTMPDFYKDFVYPELPDIDKGSGDFLFTSSFVAPNSYVCDTDSIDQRLMFVYDQIDGSSDIYVNELGNNTNGLRVYGEAGYGAAFPYETTSGPFDPLSPEAPQKDFVTINPAMMSDIVVDNKDSWEKIFFRQWFVPEYTEPTGMVWLDEDMGKVPNHNTYIWEDVVNEFTYMFTDKHYQPTYGTATAVVTSGSLWDIIDNGTAYWTSFWFPVADNDPQIGLDSFDMNSDGADDLVYLMGVNDQNGDGQKDIAIGSEIFAVDVNDSVQFLDHMVTIKGIYYDGQGEIDRVAVEIYYTGNAGPEQIDGLHVINVEQGILSAGRHTVIDSAPQFYEPWAMQVLGTSASNDKVLLRVGRLLHTAETFFVDGAEYDVAQIYGPTEDSVKYVTIRNPVPEHEDVSLNDLSVVKEAVYDGEIIPVLPPFNGNYTMIDDIDIAHATDAENMTYYYGQDYVGDTTVPDNLWYEDQYVNSSYNSIAERMFDVPAMEIYFTGKDTDPRFHTNLLEILYEEDYPNDSSYSTAEMWSWLHIRTMPDSYKEFVYPDVPDAEVPNGEWVGDYLLTSSLTAPNSIFFDDGVSPSDGKVDLFLLVDGSGSISTGDYDIQKQGIASAIVDPSVVPQDGSVSLCVIQFSSTSDLIVPLTTIDSQVTADGIAAIVQNMTQPAGTTNMASAIDMAIANLPADLSGNQVIDLSTDGVPDSEADAIASKDNAIFAGFDAVNALGVGSGVNEQFLRDLVYPQPSDDYPGAYSFAADFNEFSSAIAEKIVKETKPVSKRLMFTYDPTDGTGLYMNSGAQADGAEFNSSDSMKGDHNGDKVVNFDDFVEFAAAYDSAGGNANYNVVFDSDNDVDVDFDDFVEFAGAYTS